MNTTALEQNVQPTMSSIELCEYINAERDLNNEGRLRHDNLMAKIPKVIGNAAPSFEGTSHYTNGAGHTVARRIYNLPKREACLVAMSYSYDLQATVFDRMTELEQVAVKPALPNFSNPVEAARAWADAKESEQKALAEAQAAKPAIEFTNQVSVAHDAITIGEAAKAIGTGRNRLCSFLRHQGWINRHNEPYQSRIESGLMDVKVSKWEHPEQGLKESITALVTRKGLVKLQRLWAESKGAAA